MAGWKLHLREFKISYFSGITCWSLLEGHVALHEGKKRFPNEKLNCNAHFLKLNPFAPRSDYHYILLTPPPESHIKIMRK